MHLSYVFSQQRPAPVLPRTRAFILAISVCYTVRLLQRDEFENNLVLKLKEKRHFTVVGVEQLRREICW